jgi:NAD-dependent dihydropyrimidine dehydrogenase PreA subunit
VHIDEEKCNGCAACVPSCAEGALQIIDNKARIVSEIYCDGLGACLGECPQGAITIEERLAPEFDDVATDIHLKAQKQTKELPVPVVASPHSMLSHWPVQLTLVSPSAPFMRGSDIVLAADCVPFAYPNFHRDFLKDHTLLVACPKLDDFEAHLAKLTEVLSRSVPKSLTVVTMEVPCCSGLVYMAREAIKRSGKDISLNSVTIGIKGDVLAVA